MNAIMAIYPYKDSGLWVFDDERVGLDKEPFIAGADTLIDRALEAKGIADGGNGFRLLFSAGQFPDARNGVGSLYRKILVNSGHTLGLDCYLPADVAASRCQA